MASSALRPAPSPVATPLVSVVTATYNWSSVLRHAIESVRHQTYPNWEHIVVGDACTDDSEQVVASFGDPRIRWLNRQQNSGSQSLPNRDGIAAAGGEWVAYLGHDDLWAPDHLQRLLAAAERNDAEVAFSLTEMIGPPGSGLRLLSGLIHGSYDGGTHIAPSSLLHRRELAARVGNWRDYRETEMPPDMDFTIRLHGAAPSFACTWAMTCFKLPSAIRPNSYLEQPSHEQAALLRRIRDERGFAARELGRVLRSRLRHDPQGFLDLIPKRDAGEPKGASVRAFRRARGLDPDPR